MGSWTSRRRRRSRTKQLLPYLPNGHQVVLPGFGHSMSIWTEQPEAGTRLVNTFLDSGTVDDSLYEPQAVDFTPELSHGAMAKIVLSAMLGMAALTVLSILWMARRVHKRGRFGHTAGATLRTLYPIVLGFGGWFLGALIVMTKMPDVPIDDELLVSLSAGVPIGLGLYYAWVDRDMSSTTKTTGFAATVAAALIGAWLGFNAAEGLLALVTAICGAAVGGNLILLVLDITWGRPPHARSARSTARATLEARPTTGPLTPGLFMSVNR